MRPTCLLLAALAALVHPAQAQTSFGASCAGASGVTPELSVTGLVASGSPWTLEVTAPGGIGLGYLLVGFSNTSASALGGVPLPLDLGAFFADPLWSTCVLNVDPSYLILPYTFDPNANGGAWSKNFPGFDTGLLYMQALNIDPDFTTRIAGVSAGLVVRGADELAEGMVAIAAGSFTMGSDAAAAPPYSPGPDEDQHLVTISQAFWMGRHEVTQAHYEAVMGSNPSQLVGPNRPVENVSQLDAVAFCQALTLIESVAGNVPAGYEYRLPTEAEWEYACRAGTTTEFGVGNGTELFCSDAHIANSLHSGSSCGNPIGAAVVGSYAPNAWGLFDMHGNVQEWCLDTYATYPTRPVVDPFNSGGTLAMLRGGTYSQDSSFCRSASRQSTFRNTENAGIGFRVVLAPVLVP